MSSITAPSLLIGLIGLIGAPAFAQEEAEEAAYEYQDEDGIRAALEKILSQPEFERLRTKPEEPPPETKSPAWLERFADWLTRVLGTDEGTEEPSSSFALYLPGIELLIYAMAAVILGAAVFFIVKSVLAISRDKKVSEEKAEARVFGPGSAPGEQSPEDYWRRAVEHGERRRYREGIRELLLGSMSAAERKGLIRFRKGLTNRDYFYSVRGPARDSFGRIANAFEHVYFGRREATVDSFRDCCREYQKSFREATA